jgi:hypothetical protein
LIAENSNFNPNINNSNSESSNNESSNNESGVVVTKSNDNKRQRKKIPQKLIAENSNFNPNINNSNSEGKKSPKKLINWVPSLEGKKLFVEGNLMKPE